MWLYFLGIAKTSCSSFILPQEAFFFHCLLLLEQFNQRERTRIFVYRVRFRFSVKRRNRIKYNDEIVPTFYNCGMPVFNSSSLYSIFNSLRKKLYSETMQQTISRMSLNSSSLAVFWQFEFFASGLPE